jgi:hypothetical protein
MANDDTASKRRAEESADINLRRAFDDLVQELKHAYEQPALDAADTRSQHQLALLAMARFLDRVGPDDLAHFADQLATLAQTLDDVHEGIRAPSLDPGPVTSRRRDPTMVWLARACVALAVKTMQGCGHSRKSAAEWVVKRHPELEQLITESAVHRSRDLETAIISWCEDFSSHKVRNEVVARVYSLCLDKLKAWAPNCNSDQMQREADRLLQEAVAFLTARR